MREIKRSVATLILTGGTLAGLATTVATASAASATPKTYSSSSAKVDAKAKTLAVRKTPSTKAGKVKTVKNRSTVTVMCWTQGTKVKGSTTWVRVKGGGYVPDTLVDRARPVSYCPPAKAKTKAKSTGPLAPRPAIVPVSATARRLPSNAVAFLAKTSKAAQVSQADWGVPASVVLAQGILESGYGQSALATKSNNYFGIKCSSVKSPYQVACHKYPTTECTSKGCHKTTATFRAYASPTGSFEDHGRFLALNSRYKTAFKYKSNADQFAKEIAKAGYATDPAYPGKLIKLMKDFDLYRYN
ncbi:sporangiospore maturation cell wall hydrolase GsmA [Spirillospora albida]|uniref:sporangiospore maturation cell wall hydrolase GsmA n=1 Tax=Spirillospora albida TaxID=58123 RepID=UPI00147082FF|nr:sporangiospore maturation cell wall hydrolase GsmA [Spirillospora albida]